MEKALHQAKDGRMHILGIMNEAISAPRENLSPYAPRLITMKVETDQIGLIIGPGGKTIQGMQRLFGVDINIDDDGNRIIYCIAIFIESQRPAELLVQND